MHLFLALLTSALLAQTTPSASPSVSPVPNAAPAGKRVLALPIPPGWQRTETGHYNQWTSSDGTNFRVTAMPALAALQGPNAIAVVKMLMASLAPAGGASAPDISKVLVCSGAQPAYRVDHLLGATSTAFMMLIPGTTSTGLINYEVHPGQTADPAMLQAIGKICWP